MSYKQGLNIFLCGLITIGIAACGGLSEEELVATAIVETRAAATPTPLPINLTITLQDDLGNPMPETRIKVKGKAQKTNADGLIQLADIDDSIQVEANQQGYELFDETFSLNQGENAITIQLERNPFGLLPTDACNTDETLLFIEDFEDRLAENFYGIDDGALDEYSIGVDGTGNVVMRVENINHEHTFYMDGQFENTILRFRIKFITESEVNFMLSWQASFEKFAQAQYTYIINTYEPIIAFRQDGREGSMKTDPMDTNASKMPSVGEWHLIEVGTFDGVNILYLDGELVTRFTDKDPLDPGSFGFGQFIYDTTPLTGLMYVDDFSICGLTTDIKPLDKASNTQ